MRCSFVALMAALLAGCASESPPACAGWDAGQADGDASPTARRVDVDAIVERSCSFATCHGTRPGTGGLYLPPRAKGDWYKEVVNVVSRRAPKLKRVEPGDPGRSFLAQKIVGAGLCTLASSCDEGGCGARMPKDDEPLPAADIATILEWIRAGAPET